MSVELRREGVKEIDLVEPLWRELYRHHVASARHLAAYEVGEDASWVTRRDYYERLFATPRDDAFFTLASIDGELVGYAMTAIVDEPAGSWDFGRTAELHTLSVHPDHRRKGIGASLLDSVRTHLRARGVTTLQVEVVTANGQAQAFYRKMGLLPFVSTVIGPV